MLKNTFKPTLRRLLRDKPYLLVSILSLATGLLCCLLIFKYVLHEWSYDRFHQEADRIYRLEMEVFTDDGVSNRYAYLVARSVNWLYQVPEIETETRFVRFSDDMSVEVNGNRFSENGMITADSTFFELFSFGFIKGKPHTALSEPNSVVISRSTAQKYFNTSDILGETLLLRIGNRETIVTITGVLNDVPSNSHFSFDMVTSPDVYEQLFGIDFHNVVNAAYSYIRIAQNSSVNWLEEKINDLYTRNSPEASSVSQFHLKPMADIYLHSSSIGELSVNSNAAYIYLFVVIAFIILGIACINFAMLAAARSARRAREAGMRKVFGAGKNSLVSAVMAESSLLAFTGLILAILLAWNLLPYFNLLSGKHFTFAGLFSPSFLLLMAGVTVFTGIAAGFYPALLLTGNHAKTLLQENIVGGRGSRRGLLWKVIVVVQIAISIGLISATYIIHKQIDFIFTQDPGFDKEQMITLPNYFGDQIEVFINKLDEHHNIKQTTVSWSIPGISKKAGGRLIIEAEGISGTLFFEINVVDHHFFDTYDIPIIEGRNFTEQLVSDSTQAFILNETAVEALGWADPLGKKIKAWGIEGYVIGVVKDVNFTSFHNEIKPMVFFKFGQTKEISAKIRSSQYLSETLTDIEEIWNELLPGIPFRYEFVDDRFAEVYEAEQRAQSLFFSFSVLTIVIAVLGLFSFTSYMIRKKTREIGIRKVLGATLYDILKLFYTGYAKLLLIATLIAVPAAYLWMRNWLENFAYRTEIGADVLLISFGLVLVVLILSVSYQIIKGALQNPAEVIRAE